MLRVLTYHRVGLPGDTPSLDPSLISATPLVFARQMEHLANRYHVVSMEEALNAAQKGTRLPKRAVLLTFDDAYRDFGEIAWPILRQYRLPATLFVPTAYPDQPEHCFWWDRLHQAVTCTSQIQLGETPLGSLPLGTWDQRRRAVWMLQDYVKTIPHAEAMALIDRTCASLAPKTVPRARVLGWHELRQLAQQGVTLGGHTRTHPLLPRLPLHQVREEVKGCLQDLEREVGNTLPVLSYPNGSHDEMVRAILKEEGVLLAFGGQDGENRLGPPAELLQLRRTNITLRTSLPIFRLRLRRAFTYLDLWRHRKQRSS